jgi:acyl-coenzyme A synthetase/AMP-(fatty) acid ligase
MAIPPQEAVLLGCCGNQTLRLTKHLVHQDTVARWPNKVAVEFVDDGRKLTFREMDLLANKFANFFASQVTCHPLLWPS